jgi:signal transduction histidine kinase
MFRGSPGSSAFGVTDMREQVEQLGNQMEMESDFQGAKIRVVLLSSGMVQ